MVWKAVRNISKNGNSYTIAIPRRILLNMSIGRGTAMEIVYDEDRDEFVVKPVEGRKSRHGGMSYAREVRAVQP